LSLVYVLRVVEALIANVVAPSITHRRNVVNHFVKCSCLHYSVVAAALCFSGATSIAEANPNNAQPGVSARAPGATVSQQPGVFAIKKPDLIAENAGPSFLFRVRNVGTANSPASVTRVMCYTNVAGPPTERCVEGTHFVVLPGVVLPPGTTKAGSNVWNVPTGGLDAGTGFTTFSLNIKTVPALQQQGLRFQVCADGPATIAELNEGNNCQWFVHNWPN
jgi:CARDB